MQIPEASPSAVQDSLLAICLFAAFADGDKSDEEREAVRKIADELGSENAATLSRQILMRKLPIETAVAGLTAREDRLLAYEMALGVCEAGGSVSADEKEFLASLRTLLDLGEGESQTVEETVAAVALQPVDIPVAATPPPVDNALATVSPPLPTGPDNGPVIMKYAILNGALELLPETLATMAIVPLQMKMVYGIGKSHGVELDRAHIKEFLATAGLGLGSQVLEGFARKLMRGLGRKVMGKIGGSTADQLTGSAFSFASTYAIGQVAERYYADGRKLDGASMRSLFASMQAKGQEFHASYLPQIQEKAKTINPGSLMSMVTGSMKA